MSIATLLLSDSDWAMGIGIYMGIVLGIILTFVGLLFWGIHQDNKKEKAEFRSWRDLKNQPPETVDAQFLEVTPKELNPHSQSLVRRNTNLTRRDI